MVRITSQLSPVSKEVLSYCEEMSILNNDFSTDEADRIFTSLVAVFGADAVLDTITRTHAI